jgi:dihydrofolate reductase
MQATRESEMRELVLQMGVSIDGYVATVDGAHDWGYHGEDPATTKWKLASLWGAGAHLMGRRTYEDMASVWPKSSSDVAAAMNEIPKVVFSKTLARAEWPESQIAAGDLAHEIALLKAQDGGYLLAHGGAMFAQALSRERLVDEYRLVIHPAALGAGLPLFKDLPSRMALELVETHTYSTGAALHVYRPR